VDKKNEKDANIEALIKSYYIGDNHYNLFDTDQLSDQNHISPNSLYLHKMIYTLEGGNYVFISDKLNAITSLNILSMGGGIEYRSKLNEIIVLFSKSQFEKTNQTILKFKDIKSNIYFRNMYEEINSNLLTYEEMFIKIEEAGDNLDKVRSIIESVDNEIFSISGGISDKFQISKPIMRDIIIMIKNGYDYFYRGGKSFEDYIEHIYNTIIRESIEDYMFYNENVQNIEKVRYIIQECFNEFLLLKEEVIQIGEICEFILYFIGDYKAIARQTCADLFLTFFGNKVFKNSKLHNIKKIQLIETNNKIKLEHAKYKNGVSRNSATNFATHSKKIKILSSLVGTLEEEINYIEKMYKLHFFVIFYSFIEYPFLGMRFKRKIDISKKNLLYNIHKQLLNCTMSGYIFLFPSLMENFIYLSEEERVAGCSYINELYTSKKLEDIIIDIKKGTIVENLINSLYDIKGDDKIIGKKIAFILYVAIYFYL
jgi:hypothetical protein